jgi:hypothetical protein
VTRRYISSDDCWVKFRTQITSYLFYRNVWRTATCVEGNLARKNKSLFLFLVFQSPLFRKIVLFIQNCINLYVLPFEPATHPFNSALFSITVNVLKPTGCVMHQQFNIQQLYALLTPYLCVLYLSEKKRATSACYNINWLIFIIGIKCAYCAVRTWS